MIGAGAVLVVLAVVLLVVRLLPAYMKFRRMELAIPGPPSLPLLGNTLSLVGADEKSILDRVLALWGGRTALSKINFCGRLGVFVSDPDDIEQLCKRRDLQDKSRLFYEFIEDFSRRGLFTLNGSDYRAHRKLIQPAFHPEVLSRFVQEFAEEAKNFVDGLVPNMEHEMEACLQAAVGRMFYRTALSSDVDDAFLDRIVNFVQVMMRCINSRVFSPWLWPNWTNGLTTGARKARDELAAIADYFRVLMETRREHLGRSAVDGDEDFIKMKPILLDILVREATLPETDMIDELIAFLVAAIDTSATTLGWVLKVLSVRPDVQAKLQAEVDAVLGDGGVTEKADLDRLEYMERVIKETLRLLPSVPFVARTNQQKTEFAGYDIPAHTTFFLNIIGVHRDARHWDDPLRFDPDRFTPERSEGRHPFAFMAFSAGSRNCIGYRYAMLAVKTVLATTVQRYSIDPVSDGHTEPSKFPMTFDIASRMIGGVRVILRERVRTGNSPTMNGVYAGVPATAT